MDPLLDVRPPSALTVVSAVEERGAPDVAALCTDLGLSPCWGRTPSGGWPRPRLDASAVRELALRTAAQAAGLSASMR